MCTNSADKNCCTDPADEGTGKYIYFNKKIELGWFGSVAGFFVFSEQIFCGGSNLVGFIFQPCGAIISPYLT